MIERREVALVTGAASGIGRATARRLSRRGAAVGILDLDAAAATEVVDELTGEGGRAIAVPGDVSRASDLERAATLIVQRFGGLTTVVANAGIDVVGDVADLTDDVWDRGLAVNLTGVFLTVRHTFPHLLSAGGGSFVAVASAAGVKALAGNAAYCAAKHGVVGLVRTLAIDYGPRGIRSNAVCPGFVETPMVATYFADSAPAGERERRIAMIPAGRLGDEDEIAAAIEHLTSRAASYTNGTVHVVDGGAYAGYFRPATGESGNA